MTLPKHSPERSLTHDDSYEGNIRCYGNPPKGYRWLNIGDPVSKDTLMVSWGSFIPYNKDWEHMPRREVAANEWPAIEPITKPARVILGSNSFCVRGKDPEPIAKTPKAKPVTVGDRHRDALVLEEVSRSKTNVRFKIVKQRYRKVCFDATSGISLCAASYPAIYERTFYLRAGLKHRDRDILSCPTEKFDRIAAAVREYNDSVRPKSAPKPAPAPLAQIKTLLLATPEIAADVMRECVRVIADRK